jgi:gliding motility associated protien GldN
MNAQENISGVFNNEPVNPCGSENNTLILSKHQVPEAYNREADIMWNKRVWREIDFREKINQPLYFPVEFQPCKISLFQLIGKHVLTGEIIAFADENFYSPLTLSMVKNKLVESQDIPQVIYDEKGNEYYDTIKGIDSVSIYSKVIKVRMIEDWYINSGRSDMEVRIIGMAFYEYVEEKEAYKELFWVYYPAVKPFLAKYRSFNPKNTMDRSSFEDVFTRREFGSRIIKESNVYDRYVFDYSKGIDALLESDKIKNDIFKYEHDLWHY